MTVKAPAPAAPTTAASFPGDGTYLVGSDIKPGTHRAKGADGIMCYWARLKSADGSMDSILANGNVNGPIFVTIKASDKAFEVRGCQEWTRVS